MTNHAAETVQLTQEQGYAFEVRFDAGMATLLTDLPPPLGQGQGPSPEQLLAASVANCLAASLAFSLRKFHQQSAPIAAEASLAVGRNAARRLRVESIAVTLTLGQPAAALQHLDRALAQFEDFCTVTQSVRNGIDVSVTVLDVEGTKLK